MTEVCRCGKDPGGLWIECSNKKCDHAWWHAACGGFKKEMTQKQLKSIGDWECPVCALKNLKLTVQEFRFEDSILGKMDEKLDMLKKEINDIKEVKLNIANISKQQKETKDWFGHVSDQDEDGKADSRTGKPAKTFASIVAKEVVHQSNKINYERETREKNVIVFRVPESVKDSRQGQKKDDEIFIKDMCDVLNLGNLSIEKIVRIGSADPDKKRPVKLTFKSVFDKRTFLASLYKLKEAAPKFKETRVQHDLTPEDRMFTKTLLAEAHKKNEDEKPSDFLFKVRGPPGAIKIVKIFNQK